MMSMGGRMPSLGDIRQVMAKKGGSVAAATSASAGGRGRSTSDMPYSSNSATTASRPTSLESLIATIPSSPTTSLGSPSREEASPGGSDEPPTPTSGIAMMTPVQSESSEPRPTPAKSPGVAVVEFERDEVTPANAAKANLTNMPLSTVKEDESPEAQPKAGAGGWVGIGLEGEVVAVSVGTVSPDLSEESRETDEKGTGADVTIPPPQPAMQRPLADQRPIPRAIDFRRLDMSAAEPSLGQGLATKLMQDVDELSIDLSVLGDVDSISSAMTKSEAVSLAQRLGKIERRLLEAAGETGRMDALRALAKATQEQSKRSNALEKKCAKQTKRIGTLTDMAQRLNDGRKRDRALRDKARAEVEELKKSTADLSLQLARSEQHNEIMARKLAQMEKDASLRSNQKRNNGVRAKYDRLRKEARRRVEEDRATIRELELKMTAMAEVHAKKEKRSREKIRLLGRMKGALEEQVRLLGGASP